MQQRLIAIDDDCLTAFRWRSGWLDLEAEFGADAAGLARWDEYIRQNRQSVFSVFAALAEEDLQTEEIPHARGADRRALVERKLAQRFPASDWKYTRSLGRNASGRRDEKILMASLGHPEAIVAWLAPLQRAEARLAGVYTAPLLAERLARELAAGASCFLLVALLRGSLKQMLFEHKRLRFPRSIAADTSNVAATAQLCAEESAKLLRYLVVQRLLAPGAILPVVVLLHPQDLALFQSACRDQEQLRYGYADLPTLAKKHGLRSPPLDSRSDALFLQLMARRPAATQYAAASLRRFHHLGRVRSLLTAGTTALVLAGSISAGLDLAEHSHLAAEQTLLEAGVAAARNEYQLLRSRMPADQFDPGALRAVLERLETLRREKEQLPEALARVSAALERAAGVELERLDWRQEGDSAAGAKGQRMEIHASLPRVAGQDAAAQFAALEGFRSALHQSTGMAVTPLQLPDAIDAGRTLSPGDIDRIAGETPRFILRLGSGPR